MVPSNEYHFTGAAGGKLWGQLKSCKERERGKREETENVRTKTKSAESSQPLV